MSVHKLKDGRFYVQYRDKSKASGFARKYFGRGLEAERKAKEFNDSLKLRTYGNRTIKTKGPLFVDLAQSYMNAKANEWNDYALKHQGHLFNSIILPRIGNKEASRLSPADLDAYVSDRRETVKAVTVRRDLAYIQAVLNFAVERRIFLYNPVRGYKPPKSDAEVIPPPTTDEVRRMVKAAPSHLKRALVSAYFVGLRFGGELFGLRWSQFDFVSKTVLVASANKGGPRSRVVPLADDYVRLLRRWLHKDGRRDNYLIRWKGKPIKGVYTALNTAKAAAGITRRLRPYDFRHAFASALLNQGEDIKSVSEMLGHADVSITMRVYQHTNDAAKRRIVNKLPSIDTTSNVVKVVPRKKPELRVVNNK